MKKKIHKKIIKHPKRHKRHNRFIFLALSALIVTFLSLFVGYTIYTQHKINTVLGTSTGSGWLSNISTYTNYYKFNYPLHTSYSPPSNAKYLVSAAVKAAERYVSIHKPNISANKLAPMIVGWTYSEGINGDITFNNCNNYAIRGYFTNCHINGGLWQFGTFGAQFGEVPNLLWEAFYLVGDPKSADDVQRAGQAVINAHKNQIICGQNYYETNKYNQKILVYSTPSGNCKTFPHENLLSILKYTSGRYYTVGNWWTSLLARDPRINAYLTAYAIEPARFNKYIAAGWGSWYSANWGKISESFWDIIATWAPFHSHMDASDCNVGIRGWVCQDAFSTSYNAVDLYRDAPYPKGTIVRPEQIANKSNSGITSICGGNPNHAFIFPASQLPHDGKAHTYYVYAHDFFNNGSTSMIYASTPVTVTCGVPTPTPTPTAAPSPTP